MKTKPKKLLAVLITVLSSLSLVLNAACSTNHQHTFSGDWSSNSSQHWHAATCEHTYESRDRASHTYDANGICTVCGYEQQHEHEYSTGWTNDSDYHWHTATCEHPTEIKDKSAHTYDQNYVCTVCKYAHTHTYEEDWWTWNDTQHWHASTCGHPQEVADKAEHVDENYDGICDICEGETRHQHIYSDEWSYDVDNHFHAATCHPDNVLARRDVAPHVDTNYDMYCDICRAEVADYKVTWADGKGEINERMYLRKDDVETSFYIGDVEEGLYLVSFNVPSETASHTTDLFVYTTDKSEEVRLWSSSYIGVVNITKGVDRIYSVNTFSWTTAQYMIIEGFTIEKYEAPTLTAGEEMKLPVTTTSVDYTCPIPIDPNLSGNYKLEITLTGLHTGSRSRILTVKIGESEYEYKTKASASPFPYTGPEYITIGDGDTTIIFQYKGLYGTIAWVTLAPVT